MKTAHSNAGLLNILFIPGASGTFLSNILAKAVTDPWWSDYNPSHPNKLFKTTNEFINEYMHIAMIHHPFHLEWPNDPLFETEGVNWINLLVMPDRVKFTRMLAIIKQQNFDNIDKKMMMDRIYAEDDPDYRGSIVRQGEVVAKLRSKNNVLDVDWADVFERGDPAVIQSMLDLLYKGQYNTPETVENIGKQCVAYHERNMHLYNELKYDPERVVDRIISLAELIAEENQCPT